MSILEGGRDHRQVYPVASPFGQPLRECARLQLAGATDVCVDAKGELAYVVGQDALSIVDLHHPERPLVLGRLAGIGNGRQIEVQDGLAAITSRPDGLYLVDVRDPAQPKLLYHYDTVELATGVCLTGNLCLVACRHFGVELIEISDPRHPIHLSNVLAGEAQSVFVDGATMYVGAWMQRELHLFDIAEPTAPRLLTACALDGFADGMWVQDGLCFAATGHHARRLINRRKYLQYDFVTEQMLHEGYGGGHGLEIFDVADPEQPRLLSRIKMPPLFMSSNDMWDVVVSGDHAIVSDTYNGLFVINVSNPQNPYFEGYRRLDSYAEGQYRHEPPIQQPCLPVSGIAVIKDHILATSPLDGLHVIAPNVGIAMPKPPAVRQWPATPAQAPAGALFHPGSQVHGLAFVGATPIVAAGDHGLYALTNDEDLAVSAQTPTVGLAFDVKSDGELLYVAEGRAGLSVWRLSADGLGQVGRWQPGQEQGAVRQVVLLSGTGLAALHLGVNKVAFVDISRPETPTCLAISPVRGNMYYKSIIDGLFNGRYAAVAPLSPGFVWYDVQDAAFAPREPVGPELQICTIEEGLALGANGVFCIFRGQYSYTADINALPGQDIALTLTAEDGSGAEVYLSGRPTLIENSLCLLNRMNGLVTLLDVANPQRPVLYERLTLNGYPESVMAHHDALWLCCGHGGLQRLAWPRATA